MAARWRTSRIKVWEAVVVSVGWAESSKPNIPDAAKIVGLRGPSPTYAAQATLHLLSVIRLNEGGKHP
jgi:hypothetical protein